MTDFKPGDRVRVIGFDKRRREKPIGKVGTVCRVHPDGFWPVTVRFDQPLLMEYERGDLSVIEALSFEACDLELLQTEPITLNPAYDSEIGAAND